MDELERHRVERHRHNVEHAQWKVEHVRSLLELHRTMRKGTDNWREQERTYLQRIVDAERELAELIVKGS